MGDRKPIGSGAISTHEQPASEALLNLMLCIAAGKLHRLRKLRLNSAEREMLEMATAPKFLACGLQGRGKPTARKLHINPIQAVLASHQGRHPNHRFVSEYAHFNFGAVLEAGGHRAHALFNKHQFIDLVSDAGNFPAHFKGDRPEGETGDGGGIQLIEQLVGEKACRQTAIFVSQREEYLACAPKYEPAKSVTQPKRV